MRRLLCTTCTTRRSRHSTGTPLRALDATSSAATALPDSLRSASAAVVRCSRVRAPCRGSAYSNSIGDAFTEGWKLVDKDGKDITENAVPSSLKFVPPGEKILLGPKEMLKAATWKSKAPNQDKWWASAVSKAKDASSPKTSKKSKKTE